MRHRKSKTAVLENQSNNRKRQRLEKQMPPFASLPEAFDCQRLSANTLVKTPASRDRMMIGGRSDSPRLRARHSAIAQGEEDFPDYEKAAANSGVTLGRVNQDFSRGGIEGEVSQSLGDELAAGAAAWAWGGAGAPRYLSIRPYIPAVTSS